MNTGICLILIRFLPFLLFKNLLLHADIPLEKTKAADKVSDIYRELNVNELSYNAFLLAYDGFSQIHNRQLLQNDSLLTIIDYTLPSNQKRLWIIDIKNHKILENSLVAHGKASGTLRAESFSDIPQSHQSSLGFFVTGKTYNGKHGYSLTIDGIEEGINENARKRAIVFHGASYVSTTFIEKNGRLGRSFGCPALPVEDNTRIIDLIKDCSCVFIYSPDQNYLTHSKLITPRYFSQIAH
jgi:hypothetical protein